MSWGSKKTDGDETKANEPRTTATNADGTRANDPSETKVSDSAPDAPPPPQGRQAPLAPNRETANEPDQRINPHNTALGQRPMEGAEQKLNEAEAWLRDTHLGKLQEWKRRVFLGGPKSADWEEFDDFVDEGTQQERSRRSATSGSTSTTSAKQKTADK